MIVELKKKLLENPIHIENILEKFQFHNITNHKKEIRCGIDKNTNKSSIRIKLENNDYLYVSDYGRGLNCDLFSFIIKSKNVEFKDVINAIKKELDVEHFDFTKKESIFGGFYDKIKPKENKEIKLNTYDEKILIPYLNKYNIKFLKDGITFETQKKFKVGYDIVSQRITCPWWNFEGELVGIMGRYIGNSELDDVAKWMPIIPHPKSQTLFGYIENYQYLQGCDELYLGESEKFSMQLDSMDIYTGMGLGGNTIHAPQIKHIIALNPKKIIFGYDEGLDEDVILTQIEKVVKMTKFLDIKVGYIIDKKNEILPRGSKMSPTDLGKEKFLELKNKYIEWK